MSASKAQAAHATTAAAARTPAATTVTGTAHIPLCFVVDGEASIRSFLSLILHGTGIDTEEFADPQAMCAALGRRAPNLIFLNVPLESADAIECVAGLAAAAMPATCS